MRQAEHLYDEGASFALAIYVGGVAVECLLRAFKARLWANNYRFASEERLRSHLKEITGYQKIKGDYQLFNNSQGAWTE